MTRQAQVTQLLNAWRSGRPEAMEQVIPIVYDELHRLAVGYMNRDASGHTLQATALINEAYCRLEGVKVPLASRSHFIGICARLMRQILVDHARAKRSKKRGGDAIVLPIDDVDVATKPISADVLALESLLESLEKTDPRKVQIAELHYFCGTTYKETSEALGISVATLHRELSMLKALLKHSLSEGEG